MKLTIYDRIILKEIMPDCGNMLQMILMESICNKAKITAKDIDKYSIKEFPDTGEIQWDNVIDDGEEFSLENAEIEFMKSRYNELDKAGKITPRILPLCKKIRDL